MVYEMASDEWKFHSHLTNFREESASVVIRNQVFFVNRQMVEHFT